MQASTYCYSFPRCHTVFHDVLCPKDIQTALQISALQSGDVRREVPGLLTVGSGTVFRGSQEGSGE